MSKITVLYSGTPHDTASVQFATQLATGLGSVATCRFVADTRTVVGAEQWRDYQMVVGLEGYSVAQPLLGEHYATQLRERMAAAETAFNALHAGPSLVWGACVDLPQTTEDELEALGYLNDLVVAGFESDPVVIDLLSKRILLGSGGPIALINAPPSAASLADMTVIIAWRPAATTKRAIQSALPMLRVARQVSVVSIENATDPPMVPSARELADYLRHEHQVTAISTTLPAADDPPLQLAALYREIGADLLVMGGYSHSWVAELLFGSFTRYFITHRCCNLLLAH